MPCSKRSSFAGAGLLDDLLEVIEILEDLLRGAQRLLEDVVDAHQALDRLVEHQQRHHEAGEIARRSCAPALIWVRAYVSSSRRW